MSPFGGSPKRTFRGGGLESAFGGKVDIAWSFIVREGEGRFQLGGAVVRHVALFRFTFRRLRDLAPLNAP